MKKIGYFLFRTVQQQNDSVNVAYCCTFVTIKCTFLQLEYSTRNSLPVCRRVPLWCLVQSYLFAVHKSTPPAQASACRSFAHDAVFRQQMPRHSSHVMWLGFCLPGWPLTAAAGGMAAHNTLHDSFSCGKKRDVSNTTHPRFSGRMSNSWQTSQQNSHSSLINRRYHAALVTARQHARKIYVPCMSTMLPCDSTREKAKATQLLEQLQAL